VHRIVIQLLNYVLHMLLQLPVCKGPNQEF